MELCKCVSVVYVQNVDKVVEKWYESTVCIFDGYATWIWIYNFGQ